MAATDRNRVGQAHVAQGPAKNLCRFFGLRAARAVVCRSENPRVGGSIPPLATNPFRICPRCCDRILGGWLVFWRSFSALRAKLNGTRCLHRRRIKARIAIQIGANHWEGIEAPEQMIAHG